MFAMLLYLTDDFLRAGTAVCPEAIYTDVLGFQKSEESLMGVCLMKTHIRVAIAVLDIDYLVTDNIYARPVAEELFVGRFCIILLRFKKLMVNPDKNITFKVNARRARKNYPMDSMEINMELGGRLLDAFPELKVDVHKPEVLLQVEIRNKINIYSVEIPGPGGMPIGTAGKAMLLLSGGIDSPVAGYMIAKRGVQIEATYFHAPPYTSDRAKQKVVDLAKLVSRYSGPMVLNVVNFTDIQLAIYEKCPHDELTIIMRRYMMRIAEELGKKSGCLGLITGESIGQVASQTMQSLYCTNEVCEMPVFRPVIGFDKQEIIDLSEKIGTYETSIQPFEDCCTIFVAKHPVTKPNLNIIKNDEKHLDDCIEEMLKTAIDTVERIEIK